VAESNTVVGRAASAGTETRATIEALNAEVERIGAVADMISEVAARTNLLALNATIEAARAGDAGRGFAVVAGEVKALARQTAEATGDIGHRIGAVRDSAQRAMALIHAMTDRIGAVERSSGAIADSVQRQRESIDQINQNLLAAAEGIGEVASGMEQLQTDVTENAGASGQVTDTAGDVQDRTGVLRREIEYFIQASNEASDWRSFVRYHCDASVTITRTDQPTAPGRMRNMSRGGAAISCGTDMPHGAVCQLEGLLPQPVAATVVHCGDGMLRLQFSQDTDVQNRLAAFVAERFGKREAA